MSVRPRARRVLEIGAVVAIVLVIAGAIYLAEHPAPAPSCIPPAPTGLTGDPYYVIAGCGTPVGVDAHSFVSYQVPRLSDGETVLGAYAATPAPDAPAWVYVLNSTEFSALPPAPSAAPPKSFWAASSGADGNFSVQVPGSPAQFYVVLENVGNTTFSVRWTESLVMYYVTPQGSH